MTNLKTYQGKQRIYAKIPNAPRVSRLWVWDEGAKEYRTPSGGKQYYAYRYEVSNTGSQKRIYQFFNALEDAKNWQIAGTGFLALPKHSNIPEARESESNSPLFGDIVQEWKKRRFPHIAPGTRLLYEKILRLYFNGLFGLRVSDITPKRLDLWIDELKAGILTSKNRATRKNFRHELELLSTILRYYQNYYDDNTFQLPLKKRHWEACRLGGAKSVVQKDLIEAEFLKFKEELLKLKNGELLSTLATVQYYQALRISEAAGLYWEDVQLNWQDPKQSRVRIVRSVWYPHTGGMKAEIRGGFKNSTSNLGIKEQPMFPETFEALLPMYQEGKKGLIFQMEGEPVPYRVIQAQFDRAFKWAGLPYRGTHVMRHGGCRRIYNENGDLSLAQQLLGNSDLKTTLVYAKRQASALTLVSEKHWEKKFEGGLKLIASDCNDPKNSKD